jgi:hypothetical protein
MTAPTDDRIPVKPALVFAALAAATAIALAGPLLLPGVMFVGSAGDAVSAVRPHLAFIADALRDGRIPLWNPHVFTGQPELAGAQWGVLYPFQAAVLPLAGPIAYVTVSLVLHLALLAIAGYLLASSWLRAAGHAPVPAAAAAAGSSIALSGFATGHLFAGHLGIVQAMPWLVLAAFGGVECCRGRLAFGLAVAAGVGLAVLAGGPQVLPFGLLAAVLPWAVAWARAPGRRVTWLLAVAGAIVAGLAVAGAQLLPALELASESARARVDLLPAAAGFALRAGDLPGLVVPGWAAASGRAAPWEVDPWVGPIVAVLAVATLLDRRTRKVAAWGWVAVAASLALAGPLGASAQSAVPGMSLLRVPGRSVLVADVMLPLLASLAIARLAVTGRTGRLAAAGLAVIVASAGAWVAAPSFAAGPADEATLARSSGELFARLRPRHRALSVLRPAWNLGMETGFDHLGGYEPLAPWRTAATVRALSGGDPAAPWTSLYTIYPDAGPLRIDPRWDALSVRLVLADDAFSPPDPWRRLHAEGGFALWENPAARPRARFATCVTAASGPEDALARLFAEPGTDVVETADPGPCDRSAAASEVRIATDEPELLEVAVEAAAAGWLVVSDLAYPGWTAAVDGEETGIVPADGAGRAVRVPAGSHRVLMRFEPASFRVGVALTVAGLLALAGGGIAVVRAGRGRQRERFP